MQLTYLINLNSFNELKAAYKKLVLQHHPDLFQDEKEKELNQDILKIINNEYDYLSKNPNLINSNNNEQENKYAPDFEKYKDIINDMIIEGIFNIPDIKVELCGSWIWVSGNTFQHQPIFRKLNFNWCKGKKMWSWKSFENKGFYRGKNTINDIRNKYGSTSINPSKNLQIA